MTSAESPQERWVADPSIGWRILLTASLPHPPAVATVTGHLEALAASHGWPSPPVRTAADPAALRRALTAADPAPVVVGIAGSDLVVSAHHAAVDGLGLLRVLDGLGLAPVRSTARGVGERPAEHGLLGTIARRLGEAAVSPPARPRPSTRGETPSATRAEGDVLCDLEVAGTYRTAAVVHAAVRAVVDHEEGLGRAARHVAVAVGVTRDPDPDSPIADRSALLRLRDVEGLTRLDIERALRTAPVQAPPGGGTRRPWSGAVGRVSAVGMRVLGPRLGSTLLVSHLGEVSAPHVDRLAFHPVTAGGSGLSLGVVGDRGRTVLGLRARASAWDADGLERLLEPVGGRLTDG
ncbi:hypothetical protein [Nocardioides stalactiti]|uniref:hypothetical protein n=1 Tax=Nocardioides stalactiti TaxID=2755356 RepID=UPI00160296DE|nr:hypothetical protein [Nocardioides stalactiti]